MIEINLHENLKPVDLYDERVANLSDIGWSWRQWFRRVVRKYADVASSGVMLTFEPNAPREMSYFPVSRHDGQRDWLRRLKHFYCSGDVDVEHFFFKL